MCRRISLAAPRVCPTGLEQVQRGPCPKTYGAAPPPQGSTTCRTVRVHPTVLFHPCVDLNPGRYDSPPPMDGRAATGTARGLDAAIAGPTCGHFWVAPLPAQFPDPTRQPVGWVAAGFSHRGDDSPVRRCEGPIAVARLFLSPAPHSGPRDAPAPDLSLRAGHARSTVQTHSEYSIPFIPTVLTRRLNGNQSAPDPSHTMIRPRLDRHHSARSWYELMQLYLYFVFIL
jgi:hypothetical protein